MEMVLTPMGLRFAGRLWPCSVGKGGIRADKREGDGATPTGDHRIALCDLIDHKLFGG